MSTHDDFDSQLADAGDDRPGIDELDDVENLDDDDFDDDYDDDYPEDAGDDEIDLDRPLRRGGQPSCGPAGQDLANDLDGLVEQPAACPGTPE